MNAVDLIGRTFGRLTVVRLTKQSDPKKGRVWQCRCDCGRHVKVTTMHLNSGATKSCGCWRRDRLTEQNYRHGKAGSSVYARWCHMLQRCLNPEHAAYKNYGGRGITVCRRWLKFKNFYADMGDPPRGLTLERKDNDRGYNRRNCVWATYQAQARNRRVAVPAMLV